MAITSRSCSRRSSTRCKRSSERTGRATAALAELRRAPAGKLFDDRGNRMSPSHAMKAQCEVPILRVRGARSGNKSNAGSVRRVAAQDMENRVVTALRTNGLLDPADADPREALHAVVDRITIASAEITVAIRGEAGDSMPPEPIRLPWTPPDHRRRRSMAAAINGSNHRLRRADP